MAGNTRVPAAEITGVYGAVLKMRTRRRVRTSLSASNPMGSRQRAVCRPWHSRAA